MIEILKLIGSALVAASATLISLYLKRKWEKQDKHEEKKEAAENKIDKIAAELDSLGDKVDSLSKEFIKEIIDIRREDTALESGLREILYDRIKFLCRKYIAEGRIGEEDYNSLQRMWRVYHDGLKGNGYLDSIMAEVEDLEKIK